MNQYESGRSGPGQRRRLLSARETATALGVKPATLYAYVSRGLLAREHRPGHRGSWFDPAAVDRLASRGRAAAGQARRELRIESAVTSIAPGGHAYRGHDAGELARTASFERVAELLWTGTLPASEPTWSVDAAQVALGRAVARTLPSRALPFDRVRLVTAALASADPFRHDLRPDAVASAARSLVVTLVEVLPARRAASRRRHERGVRRRAPLESRHRASARGGTGQAARRCARAPRRPRARRVPPSPSASPRPTAPIPTVRSAPASACWAARGTEPPPWRPRRCSPRSPRTTIPRRSSSARSVAASGCPASVIPSIPTATRARPCSSVSCGARRRGPRRLRAVEALLDAVRARRFPEPNVDLAIAALGHVLELPRGTGELIFALARIAGWIAHALEEYERPSPLRLRAVYTGMRAGPDDGP